MMSLKLDVRNSLIMAAALIVLALAVSFADRTGVIGGDTAKRIVQVAIGLIVVYCSNLAPKTLEPLTEKCDPARVQALQRFAGWTLVIGGLGYSLTWLVSPMEHAAVISMAILGTALLLVLARYAWTLGTREQS